MEEAKTDAAAAAIVPLTQLRIDLENVSYAPVVSDADGRRAPMPVVRPMSTSFRPHTVTALMGPSGSWKTSLLTVVAGFVNRAHVGGTVRVNGEDAGARDERRSRLPRKLVGLVFQVR